MEPTPEELARRIFGERAASYAVNPAHDDPFSLARLVELARPRAHELALDVATGAGHTALALAPRVARVVGLDLVPQMLTEARRLAERRGLARASFVLGDAHRLPFPDRSFQLVTVRRAPHHFSNLGRALSEVARVVAPGGRLAIDDRTVPEGEGVPAGLEAVLDRLERLHDRSHVRNRSASEWRCELARDFELETLETWVVHRPIRSLTEGADPADARAICEILDSLAPPLATAFGWREVEGVRHSNHWYVRILARRRELHGAERRAE